MPEQISRDQYDQSFPVSGSSLYADATGAVQTASPRALALQNALDIRKFEIQLYWTRSAYFWTFIGAALVAYGTTQTLKEPERTDLAVSLCSVGLVFSVAWYFANRGSKQWQENWENHVDRLEDEINGPIYKTVLTRPEPKGLLPRLERVLTGPGPYSVSKINQLISLYICLFWALLLWRSLPKFRSTAPFSWPYAVILGLSALLILLMAVLGRTHVGDHTHVASRRRTTLEGPRRDRP